MNIPAEFDEIRPYLPEELPQIFEELIADPTFASAKPIWKYRKPFSTSCFMTSWISIVTDSTWTPHL